MSFYFDCDLKKLCGINIYTCRKTLFSERTVLFTCLKGDPSLRKRLHSSLPGGADSGRNFDLPGKAGNDMGLAVADSSPLRGVLVGCTADTDGW